MMLHALDQPRNRRRLFPVASLLILTATASVCLWRAQPAHADSKSLVINTSPAMTLKFSAVPPNSTFPLLGQPGVATGIPPTTDTRLITISNTGTGNIDVTGLDNTSNPHFLATVGPGQTVALLVPTVWFTTALSVTNFGATAGEGVVTIN